MNVHTPLDIEDDDIANHFGDQPLSTPTAMSYAICRLDLAKLSRQITYKLALGVFQGRKLQYHDMLRLDSGPRSSLEVMPEFFNFGTPHDKHTSLELGARTLVWQRNMLHIGYNLRFSRLHREIHLHEQKRQSSHTLISSACSQLAPSSRLNDSLMKSFQC